MVLTSENKDAAREFKWHESRDRIFFIYDESTFYELGGTPHRRTTPESDTFLLTVLMTPEGGFQPV